MDTLPVDGYERVVYCKDDAVGLRAYIAIHSTVLGPALGGVRMHTYKSDEDALTDVLRLAKAMTYKASAAGLGLGGGKTVVIGDPKKDKSADMLRSLGSFIECLNGSYIAAEDSGTTEHDMDIIYEKTKHVTGLSEKYSIAGNPSPSTAYGVYHGMKAVANQLWGEPSLKNKTVAVQGLGNVSFNLCRHLHEGGANLIVTDVDEYKVKRAIDAFHATAVVPDEIYSVICDIFSPNALGGVINDNTIPLLKAKAIAGAANNVLEKDAHGDRLHQKGILYAPDYVLNAGGLIHCWEDFGEFSLSKCREKLAGIYTIISDIFIRSEKENKPPSVVADVIAMERLQ